MESPQERYAYVTAIAPDRKSRADSVFVVDVGAGSGSFGKVIGQMDLPDIGDELHHFGWNACSTALCPYAPHPGLRSSRIHIIDTKPDPTNLEIVKTIEPDEVFSACRLFRHQPQRGRIFLGGREASMSLIH
jgi:selenium-binding protein 1